MRDVARVREHDQQNAPEPDHQSRRPQPRDRLAKREPSDQSDEERRGVQQHGGDGRSGAFSPNADADLLSLATESVRRRAEKTLDEDAVLPVPVEHPVAALDADLLEPGGAVRGPAGLVVGEHAAGQLVQATSF